MTAEVVASVQPEALPEDKRPLVVDLDGTLIKSDLLLELLFQRIGVIPPRCLACFSRYPPARPM